MIEFEAKIKGIAVPVPGDDGYDYQIREALGNTVIAYKYKTANEGSNSQAIIAIPKGNYEIIGLTSEILKSEELARKVTDCEEWFTSRRAFQSLLDKYNIKGEHLILEVK